MQMYNEEVNDLLEPANKKLPVHESREAGVYVAGLREDIVTSPDAVMGLLARGEAHRHFGETRMNTNSSRSHTLFRMVRVSGGFRLHLLHRAVSVHSRNSETTVCRLSLALSWARLRIWQTAVQVVQPGSLQRGFALMDVETCC